MRERSGRYDVSLDGRLYSVAFQRDLKYQNKWQALLRKHYRQARAICQCPGRGKRELVIRRYDATDTYYLARISYSGEQHAHGCHYYAAAPEKSGLQCYQSGVVVELSEGEKRVRLQVGLLRPALGCASSHSTNVRKSGGATQDAIKLRGLLDLLWADADLATWRPGMLGKRSAPRVGYWLRMQAAHVLSSRVRLADVMLTHARRGSHEEQLNQTVMRYVTKRNYRAIAVDALTRFDETKHVFPLARVPFSGPFGMPFANLSDAAWELLQRSFARELSAWKSGRKVIVIAQIEPSDTTGKRGAVRDVALMVVSDEWVPVDSSYEAKVEMALREQGRAFIKPLRFDATEDVVIPDFWLLDVGKDYPLEVFGMTTDEYMQRKAEKITYYDMKYGAKGWWYWDAEPGGQIPAFPSVK